MRDRTPGLNRLARAVRRRRSELGLSQPQLAEKAGVSIGTIHTLEAGRRLPYERNRLRIERALEWPDGHIDRLFALGDAPTAVAEPDFELEAEQPETLQRLVIRRLAALTTEPLPDVARRSRLRPGLLVDLAEGRRPILSDDDCDHLAELLNITREDVRRAQAQSDSAPERQFGVAVPSRFGDLTPQEQLHVMALIDGLVARRRGADAEPMSPDPDA